MLWHFPWLFTRRTNQYTCSSRARCCKCEWNAVAYAFLVWSQRQTPHYSCTAACHTRWRLLFVLVGCCLVESGLRTFRALALQPMFFKYITVNMACNLTQAAQSIDLPIKRSGGRQQQPFRHRGCLLRSIYSRALCAKVTVYFKLSAWYFSCVVFFQYKSVPLYGVAVSCRFALPSFANFCKGRRRATNEVCQLFYCHNKKRCCSQDKTYFALGQAYFVWECSCTSCWWRMYLLTFLSIFSVLKNRKAQRFQVLTWLFGRKLCQ